MALSDDVMQPRRNAEKVWSRLVSREDEAHSVAAEESSAELASMGDWAKEDSEVRVEAVVSAA